MSGEIEIIVNGDARRVPEGTCVAQLIALLGLPAGKVAVERNLEIVPKSTHDNVLLSDGDRLEIVHFVGGGSGPAL